MRVCGSEGLNMIRKGTWSTQTAPGNAFETELDPFLQNEQEKTTLPLDFRGRRCPVAF